MQGFKNLIKEQIGENAFENYFKNSTISKKDNELIFLGANLFTQRFVLTQYKKIIEQLAEQYFKQNLSFVGAAAGGIKTAQPIITSPAPKQQHSVLNSAFNFENFIVGESNNYAYSVCKEIAQNNKFGKLFNPIFIYSATGLGKTHLLHASGQLCLANGKKVVLKTSKTFKNDYQAAQQSNNWEQFNEQFKDCELLLIDDVQFLANTESMQVEFFHIFNDVIARGGQIIMTSDVAPKDLSGIAERLKSRFANGCIANITPPDIETKQAILRKKCELYDIKIEPKILNMIANYIGKNIRDIEGMITSIHAWQQYTGEAITMDGAKKLVGEYINEQAQMIEIEDIFAAVSEAMSVKVSQIQSTDKSRKVVTARRVVIFLAKELLQNAVGQIAVSLKMKTHSNVSHHLKTINKLLAEDEEFFNLCESIKNKLLNKN